MHYLHRNPASRRPPWLQIHPPIFSFARPPVFSSSPWPHLHSRACGTSTHAPQMAASLWLLQLPSPPPLSTNHSHSPSSASPLPHRKHAPTRARGSLACSSSGSSSSSSSVVTKDEEGAAAAEAAAPAPAPAAARYDYKDDPNFRGCKGCGREETERGCNGEGRIMGGIAAVPLFGWWPIKAYRPCPGFVASGGRYRRYGQSMDDVIAGKGRKMASDKKKSDK